LVAWPTAKITHKPQHAADIKQCDAARLCNLTYSGDFERLFFTVTQSGFIGVKRPDKIPVIRRIPMVKSVSICAALILAAAVFADSAEARQGFGGKEAVPVGGRDTKAK
jgi:hypothetical protein